MAFDWGQLVGAAVGAYGARQAANQANRPQNTTTNQTTRQSPYGEGLIAPDIEAALDYQRQLMAAGPRYVGSPSSGSGGGGGGGAAALPATGGGGAARRPNSPTTWTNARGEQMSLNAQGRAVRGGSGGAGAGGVTQPTAPTSPTGIEGISNEVARRGFDAANDPATLAAQRGVGNILSGQGGANSGGSGFQGYNPIDDWLAGQLRGDVSNRNADDLIRQFLGAADGSYGDDPNGTGASGGGAYTGSSGPVWTGNPSGGSGGWNNSGSGGGGGGYGGAGNVPDTVGGSNSYFATQLRDLMNTPTNDANLQTMIDAQNADVMRGTQQDLWALDAQAQGTGRFGGDVWGGLSSEARRAGAAEMGINASRTRLGEQESRRNLYTNLLGQVNTRDLGAMQDATQRYGIDASSRASSSGAAESAALARRGQDLQALGLLMNNDQFGIGALGDLGGQLSGDQLAAMGLAPDLAGVGLNGLNLANNAAGNLVGHEGNANQLRAAQIGAGTARAGLRQQADLYNSQLPQQMTNDYLRMIMGIGGMGGTSTTNGQNVVPGAGINPNTAALLGGYSSWYGGGG